MESSRRGFLAATGTGVAAVAVTVPLMSAASASAGSRASGPLVAHVKDAAAGTVAVMMGEREVVVTDRDLVARIQSYMR